MTKERRNPPNSTREVVWSDEERAALIAAVQATTGERLKFEKGISIANLVGWLVMAGSGVWYASQIEARVAHLEVRQAELRAVRVSELDALRKQVETVRTETRADMQAINGKLDALILRLSDR